MKYGHLVKLDPDRLSDHTHSPFITNNISDSIDALSKTMAAIQKKLPQSGVKIPRIRRFYHSAGVSNGLCAYVLAFHIFDLVVKRVKVNPRSLFELSW